MADLIGGIFLAALVKQIVKGKSRKSIIPESRLFGRTDQISHMSLFKVNTAVIHAVKYVADAHFAKVVS